MDRPRRLASGAMGGSGAVHPAEGEKAAHSSPVPLQGAAAPLPPELPDVTVTELRRLPGYLWEVVLIEADGKRRRIVVPDSVATITGLAVVAEAVSTLRGRPRRLG